MSDIDQVARDRIDQLLDGLTYRVALFDTLAPGTNSPQTLPPYSVPLRQEAPNTNPPPFSAFSLEDVTLTTNTVLGRRTGEIEAIPIGDLGGGAIAGTQDFIPKFNSSGDGLIDTFVKETGTATAFNWITDPGNNALTWNVQIVNTGGSGLTNTLVFEAAGSNSLTTRFNGLVQVNNNLSLIGTRTISTTGSSITIDPGSGNPVILGSEVPLEMDRLAATPSNPPSGSARLYFLDSGFGLYYLDSAGDEVGPLGAGLANAFDQIDVATETSIVASGGTTLTVVGSNGIDVKTNGGTNLEIDGAAFIQSETSSFGVIDPNGLGGDLISAGSPGATLEVHGAGTVTVSNNGGTLLISGSAHPVLPDCFKTIQLVGTDVVAQTPEDTVTFTGSGITIAKGTGEEVVFTVPAVVHPDSFGAINPDFGANIVATTPSQVLQVRGTNGIQTRNTGGVLEIDLPSITHPPSFGTITTIGNAGSVVAATTNAELELEGGTNITLVQASNRVTINADAGIGGGFHTILLPDGGPVLESDLGGIVNIQLGSTATDGVLHITSVPLSGTIDITLGEQSPNNPDKGTLITWDATKSILFPPPTGTNDRFLSYDGTQLLWAVPPGGAPSGGFNLITAQDSLEDISSVTSQTANFNRLGQLRIKAFNATNIVEWSLAGAGGAASLLVGGVADGSEVWLTPATPADDNKFLQFTGTALQWANPPGGAGSGTQDQLAQWGAGGTTLEDSTAITTSTPGITRMERSVNMTSSLGVERSIISDSGKDIKILPGGAADLSQVKNLSLVAATGPVLSALTWQSANSPGTFRGIKWEGLATSWDPGGPSDPWLFHWPSTSPPTSPPGANWVLRTGDTSGSGWSWFNAEQAGTGLSSKLSVNTGTHGVGAANTPAGQSAAGSWTELEPATVADMDHAITMDDPNASFYVTNEGLLYLFVDQVRGITPNTFLTIQANRQDVEGGVKLIGNGVSGDTDLQLEGRGTGSVKIHGISYPNAATAPGDILTLLDMTTAIWRAPSELIFEDETFQIRDELDDTKRMQFDVGTLVATATTVTLKSPATDGEIMVRDGSNNLTQLLASMSLNGIIYSDLAKTKHVLKLGEGQATANTYVTLDNVSYPVFATGPASGVNLDVTATGDLSLKTFVSGDIYLTPANEVIIDGLKWPTADGTDGQAIITNGLGQLSFGNVEADPVFLDTNFRVQDNTDNTKQLAFECSGITTATTRTLTIPDSSGTISLVGHTHVEADITDLQNYSLVGHTHVLADITDYTEEFLDNSFKIKDNTDNTKIAQFECAGITTATTRTFTFPDTSGAIGITTGAITDYLCSFDSSGRITSSGILKSLSPTIYNSPVPTLGNIVVWRSGTSIYDASIDASALVTLTGSQVLTNKTIDGDNNTIQDLQFTTSFFKTGVIGALPIHDGSGVPIMYAPSSTAGHVLTSNGSFSQPTWQAASGGIGSLLEDTTPQLGGDLDANSFNIKLDDAHGILDDSSNEQLIFQKTTSATSYWEMQNGTTYCTLKGQSSASFVIPRFDCKGTLGMQWLVNGTQKMTLTNTQLDVVEYVRAEGFRADGDPGGASSTITNTNVIVANDGSTRLTIYGPTGISTPVVEWEKFYDGTTVKYRMVVRE